MTVVTSIERWFETRIPDHWNAQGVEILADQDEILVVVDLSGDGADAPDGRSAGGDAGVAVPDPGVASAGTAGAAGSRDPGTESVELAGIRRFREMTRDERMGIARAAEQTFAQKVSWGARAGDVAVIFTTTSVPVMTRLRLPERRVLDTLIDAGVARSRSDALAWCVRLVGEKEGEWISELRSAFQAVEAAREKGPRARRRVGEQPRTDPADCD
jgi:hypothetical protein